MPPWYMEIKTRIRVAEAVLFGPIFMVTEDGLSQVFGNAIYFHPVIRLVRPGSQNRSLRSEL